MKDSGIAWIGEIPEGWKVERIKTIYSERTELSEKGDEELLSVSEYYGVAPRAAKVDGDEFVSRSESLVGYKKCYKGDFVSNIMLAWKGSFGTTQFDGIVSPAYCVYTPSKEICPQFYHYLFRTDLYKTRFHLFSRGIIDSRLRLYSPFFFDVEAIIPPLAEQRGIAAFLDTKCAEVDELLNVQEQFIEELKNYKQALITETVTKGLNPNTKTKQSGIEWIGEIPEEWRVETIGSLYSLRQEKVSDKDYPPLSVGKMGVVPQLETAAKTDDGDNRKLVCVGDFAINSRSDRRGSCGISAYEGSVSLINTIITPRTEMCPQFYNWFFHTELFADEFYKRGHGIVDDLWTTRWQEMKRISIIVPPLAEQEEIAAYLDQKCAEIDQLIAIKQQKAEELREYRKSLIYEYVTGKKQL